MTEYTAQELRDQAAKCSAESLASFERCDTDGFLSQWANDITARELRAQAEIVENGGRSEFPALFDLDGNLVAAKLVETRYGYAWALLESDDPRSRFVGWFNASKARKDAARIANNAKKGYSTGCVLAPAKAAIGSRGTGLAGAASAYVYVYRTDGGFSRDAEIVETVSRYDSEEITTTEQMF